MDKPLYQILFKKAEEDLGIAKLAITNETYLEIANFHLQQASEKLLKSYLAFKSIEFPRTHDLDILYNLCSPTHPEFENYTSLGEFFNDFAVLIRYEEGIEIDMESIQLNVAIVEKLRIFIQKFIFE